MNERNEKLLANDIMLTIELESNFKLFSYRVVTPEVFRSKIGELLTVHAQQRAEIMEKYESWTPPQSVESD